MSTTAKKNLSAQITVPHTIGYYIRQGIVVILLAGIAWCLIGCGAPLDESMQETEMVSAAAVSNPPKCTDPTGQEIPCPPEPPKCPNPSTGEQCDPQPEPPKCPNPSTGGVTGEPCCTIICDATGASTTNVGKWVGSICQPDPMIPAYIENCAVMGKACINGTGCR